MIKNFILFLIFLKKSYLISFFNLINYLQEKYNNNNKSKIN